MTAARVTAGSLRFDHLVLDEGNLYWAEGRASEGGRYVVVQRTPAGVIRDITPPEFNVRSRVHEYGGASYTVDRGTVYFSNFDDQRVYRQTPGGVPEALTQEGLFYADLTFDRRRNQLICVQEDHRNAAAEPTNSIVAIGTNAITLVAGADFYSDPRVSPDGSTLTWLQWNHPNMPWDGTELYTAPLSSETRVGKATKIAGGPEESIFQPSWSPDGRLLYVSDRTGWWNLYRWQGAGESRSEAILPRPFEFGKPQWTFSQTTYSFIDAGRMAVTYAEDGRWKLGILHLDTRQFETIDLRVEPIDGVTATSREVFFIGGSSTTASAVSSMALEARGVTTIRSASSDQIDPAWVSAAEAITFDSNQQPVHAFYYPPYNPDYVAPVDERPPLMVLSHGGPTTASLDILDARIQFWTSRGFAVVDVNYGGSTGYGRAYRDRLKGQWGIVDVADCVNAAKHLVAAGTADPQRLIIRGGSAGGYTTLAALTFHDTFNAGASHYGISDIEVLAQDTHKFESRYLDSLVGPYPAAQDVYRQRSPIHFANRLSAALILFQGLEDKVVPPNQAEMMRDAVRSKGLPVAYVPFEGEQHGFRKAENIIRSLEAELYFYGAVFGFTPADPIVPVVIENLR